MSDISSVMRDISTLFVAYVQIFAPTLGPEGPRHTTHHTQHANTIAARPISYENEEEAAVDYARALFKYGGRQQQQQREPALDLSNLPPQTVIQRAAGE